MNDLFDKAESLKERSRFRESRALYKSAAKKSKGVDLINCLIASGGVSRMIGEFDAAVKDYERAVELALKLNDNTLIHDAKAGLALAYRGLGDHRRCIPILADCLRHYKKSHDAEGVAFCIWALAGAFRIKGDIPQAISAFNEAKRAFESLDDSHGVGYSLCGMGGTNRVAGRFSQSLRYYTEANEIFGDLNDDFGLAYSHCGMGNALRMALDYKGALTNFKSASAVYKKIGDIASYSYTLWSIGSTYLMLGKPGMAGKHFMAAKKNFTKTKDARGIIYCMLGTAQIKYLKGGVKEAVDEISKAVAMAQKCGFAVEYCHGRALLSAAQTGHADNKCYKSLGLRLRFEQIPFNIP